MCDRERITSFDYLCMISFLYLSGSFWAISRPGAMRIILFILLDVVILMIKKKFLISKKECILVMLMLLSLIINFEPLKILAIYFVYFISALLLKRSFSLMQFIVMYVNIITVISTASIVLWVALFSSPGLTNLLPTLTNINGVSVSNAVIAVQMPSTMRVQGIFWEPGAFQVFIGFAIIFLLFFKNIEIPLKRIRFMLVINIVAAGLTLSSTAYITLSCIFALAFFTQKYKVMGSETKKKVRILLLICLVGIVAVLNIPEKYQYLIWGKFKAYFSGANTVTLSVSTRMDAVKGAWASFVNSPILGNGESKLLSYMENNFGHTNAMFTYLNMFALYGIFVGTVMCKALYTFFSKINPNRLVATSLFVICGLMTFSENFTIVPIFLSFIFYGMDTSVNVEKKLFCC